MTLTEALPLLLQTELIRKVERFTGKPVRLRSTHAKLYAADPILMQAITKISSSLTGEERGRIAEALVHNVVRLFPGISDVSYYRHKQGEREIDFVVRVGSKVVPVEVCYQTSPDVGHLRAVREFLEMYGKRDSFGIIVTKERLSVSPPTLELPLAFFLLTV